MTVDIGGGVIVAIAIGALAWLVEKWWKYRLLGRRRER